MVALLLLACTCAPAEPAPETRDSRWEGNFTEIVPAPTMPRGTRCWVIGSNGGSLVCDFPPQDCVNIHCPKVCEEDG